MNSPFTLIPGEKLKYSEIKSVSADHVSSLGTLILITINTLLLSNANLSYRYCCECLHLTGVPLDSFRQELTTLASGGYLHMLEIAIPAGSVCTVGKIYRLAKQGQEYLRSIGMTPQKTGYAAALDVAGAKKLLSVQQAAMPYFRPGCTVQIAAPIFETQTDDKNDHIFRTQAFIQESGRTILMESVRSLEKIPEFMEKLRRINMTLTESRYLNETFTVDTEVILVCTDDNVLAAAAEMLRRTRGRYCFRISAVTDSQLYRGENVRYSPIYEPHMLFSRFSW